MALNFNIKSSQEISGYYVVFEGSSSLEFPGVRGITHLMEHLMCKGLDKYMDEFDAQCINNNAFTDMDRIVFFMSGMESNLSKYRDNFLNLITEFKITEQQLENEKKIVMQEYTDYMSGPESAHATLFFRKYFNHYMPIGYHEDIKNITLEQCNEWLKYGYGDPMKIIDISSRFSETNKTKNIPTSVEAKFTIGEYECDTEGYQSSSTKSIIFCSPLLDSNISDAAALCDLLSGSLNSPLYKIFREENHLCYGIDMSIVQFGKQYVIMISSMTSKDNVVKFKNVFEDFCNNIESHITEARFEKTLQKCTIFNKMQLLNNWGQGYANRLICPIDYYPIDKMISGEVNHESINKFAKSLFDISNWIVSVDDEFNTKL